ncbi:pentatricopeptide repeat-containing protein [Tanacetum coccineum]
MCITMGHSTASTKVYMACLPMCELDVGLKIIENERDLEWAEEEAAMASKASDDDICVTSVLDKGKGLADNGKGLVDNGKGIMVDEGKAGRKTVRSRNIGIVIGENVNPTFSKDDDSDNVIDMEQRFKGSAELEEMYNGNTDSESEYSNKSIDYLSEGEDELISLRKSSNEQVIARCGMRPEKLMDKEKGKQRKHFKYPSGGRNEGSNYPFRCYGKLMLLKKGFQLGCRPVITLDGCFLKKPNVGEILTVVELLGEDIDMLTGNGLTLISDQHKGLIGAVKDVMPLAEHRQCARHIYEGSNCEAIENGFSKCFNLVLLLVRNKPLITMLESMRVIVMERLNTMRQILEKWNEDICPNIQKRLELNKDKHKFWHVIPAGGNLFEVRNGSEAFTVDEHKRTCTCRMWQLAGLPCPHSIVVIFKLNKRPEDYIPACFRKDAYYKAYHQYLTLLGGMTFWPDSSMYSTVLPPKLRKMPGKPRKHRIRAPHERQFPNRVSKAGGVATGINVASMDVESSACNDTARSASLGDFVSVRCEGTTTATTSRGGLGVRRGRGDKILGLGVRRVTSKGTVEN